MMRTPQLIVTLMATAALGACDQLPFGRQATPGTQPLAAAPPSVPATVAVAAAVPAPAAKTQAPHASGAAAANLEAKSHVRQGFAYIAAAKNAPNRTNFDENIENAINEFSQAIQKEPGYAEAYSNRAVGYMQQQKYNKALDDLRKAAELAPDSPSVRYNLASMYSLKGDTDLALDEVDAALAKGFADYDALRKDPDLDNVRRKAEFRKVLEKHKVFIFN